MVGRSAVGRLVQRRPAMGIGLAHVGASLEQDRDQALVARCRGHPQQVVAVRAARGHQLREVIEHLVQAVEIMSLDRSVGTREGLPAVAQTGDVTPQGRPAGEPVLACHHDARAGQGQRRPVAREGGHRALGAVLGRREQPERPSLVVVEVLVVGVLQAGPVLDHAIDVGPQRRPAREAVLAGDHELRGAQLQRLARTGVPGGHARHGGRVARAMQAHQILGLLSQLLQARRGGERCGHDSLLSGSPAVRDRRAERKYTPADICLGWARPFPRTGRGPATQGQPTATRRPRRAPGAPAPMAQRAGSAPATGAATSSSAPSGLSRRAR